MLGIVRIRTLTKDQIKHAPDYDELRKDDQRYYDESTPQLDGPEDLPLMTKIQKPVSTTKLPRPGR